MPKVITEDIRLARIGPAPNLRHTFIQHDGTRHSTQLNDCANKGTLLCQIYSASFPLFHISFAFCAEEYWTDPNIDENVPQPPSRVPSPARGSDDATVAPKRVYSQPIILFKGFEPWSLGAPLHLFLHDALTNTPNRPLIRIEKENAFEFSFKFQQFVQNITQFNLIIPIRIKFGYSGFIEQEKAYSVWVELFKFLDKNFEISPDGNLINPYRFS
jgi:hypothetical protein